MKELWTELKVWIVIVAVAAVIWLIVSLGNGWRPSMMIDIDADEISYANYSSGGHRRRLDYLDNQEVIDEICRSLSGSYRYVGTWNHRGYDGGSPNTIAFYDSQRNLIATVRYRQGCICVSSKKAGVYYLYFPKDRDLSFAAFEVAADQNGYVPRYW